MLRSSLYTVIGFAIAIVVVVAGFFLIGIEQIAIHIWALAFLILSLLVSMGTFVMVIQRRCVKDTVVYSAGASAAVWLYQVAVIVSVFLVGVFNGKVGRFVFAEIAIIAAFVIISLVINLSARHVHSSNMKTSERKENGEYNKPKRGGF
jgi:hypothetical protein